jgi:hypothetical protein
MYENFAAMYDGIYSQMVKSGVAVESPKKEILRCIVASQFWGLPMDKLLQNILRACSPGLLKQ